MNRQASETPPFKVREIGEVAIRCDDLDRMASFYHSIVGLEFLSDSRDQGIIFFKIAEGYQGHTTILALFRPDAGRRELHPQSSKKPITGARSSLHHLALSISFEEQPALMEWFKKHNVSYKVQIFDWIGWRGIFIEDPEGNTVEFVAYDQSLLNEENQEQPT